MAEGLHLNTMAEGLMEQSYFMRQYLKMAALSKTHALLINSNTETTGSNPARGMD
jgi:hypothetical protein